MKMTVRLNKNKWKVDGNTQLCDTSLSNVFALLMILVTVNTSLHLILNTSHTPRLYILRCVKRVETTVRMSNKKPYPNSFAFWHGPHLCMLASVVCEMLGGGELVLPHPSSTLASPESTWHWGRQAKQEWAKLPFLPEPAKPAPYNQQRDRLKTFAAVL